jgi:hypothetical protein
MPEGAVAMLNPLPGGACPAFDKAGGSLCSIQRELGHEHLPASCRHFPRVALLEADAVRVTLSHYCPTAAWMLFKPDSSKLAIVRDAAGVTDRHEYEGFDARRTVPPFLRPGVAMDAETCRLWEQRVLCTLDSADQAPEDMLAGLVFTTDEIRNWTPRQGSLEAHAGKALSAAASSRLAGGRWNMPLPDASRLFLLAAASVPPGVARPDMPEAAEAGDRELVRPRWTGFSKPLGRYLAARFFASWSAYLGDGLRTQVTMLAVALAVVRIEAVRESTRALRPLDETLLHAAFRSSDLLLCHLSDAPGLVKGLAGVERGPTSAFLAAMGLEAAG